MINFTKYDLYLTPILIAGLAFVIAATDGWVSLIAGSFFVGGTLGAISGLAERRDQ